MPKCCPSCPVADCEWVAEICCECEKEMCFAEAEGDWEYFDKHLDVKICLDCVKNKPKKTKKRRLIIKPKGSIDFTLLVVVSAVAAVVLESTSPPPPSPPPAYTAIEKFPKTLRECELAITPMIIDGLKDKNSALSRLADMLMFD